MNVSRFMEQRWTLNGTMSANNEQKYLSMRGRQLCISIILTSALTVCIFLMHSCHRAGGTGQKVDKTASAEPVAERREQVTVPPAILNLDTFYKKYLNASGIPVISSAKVPDEALYAVQRTINIMMKMRPDVLAKMIENKARVGILARSEVTTELPEFSFLKDDTTANWDELRGIGAEIETPINSCAEENILCYGEGIDPYYLEDIVIHEFAHSVHGLGISFVDTNFDTELMEAFENAKAKGLWKNTYAGSNQDEYFAEGVQDWFNLNTESIPGDGIHNEINTREELKNYDPALYAIVKKYFPEEYGKISCHQ